MEVAGEAGFVEAEEVELLAGVVVGVGEEVGGVVGGLGFGERPGRARATSSALSKAWVSNASSSWAARWRRRWRWARRATRWVWKSLVGERSWVNWARVVARNSGEMAAALRAAAVVDSESRPCLVAFWEERALPAGVRGPVDFLAFVMLAKRFASEMGCFDMEFLRG